jgi:Family of unknown function (DUF5320)
MPRGDGTGPFGEGPFTGHGAGYCAGFVGPGFLSGPVAGGYALTMGRGFGAGRGRRNRFCAAGAPFGAYGRGPDPFLRPEEEALLLKSEPQRLRWALESIEQHLKKLETR